MGASPVRNHLPDAARAPLARAGERAGRRRPAPRRLSVEPLEARTLPSATLVRDINPLDPPGDPRSLAEVGATLFFAADDGAHGRELWKSDGTAAGTTLVKDINPGGASAFGSFSAYLTNVSGTLYFTANDGTNGYELWKSDGTAAGTTLVKDIWPGPATSSSCCPYLTNVGGTLFFRANDETSGDELWRSDGTAAGTVRVKDVRPGAPGSLAGSLSNVDGTLFFTAYDGTRGRELWRSDGTEAGTVLIKDINPGGAGSYPASLTNVNGTLFFRAFEQATGEELWRSDGTEAGTALVKDIVPFCSGPGSCSSSPRQLINVSGTLFFSAGDSMIAGYVYNWELWKSDGTAAGTVRVKDIKTPTL